MRKHNRETEGVVAFVSQRIARSGIRSEVYDILRPDTHKCWTLTHWDCGGENLHFQIVLYKNAAATTDRDGVT